MKDKIQNKINQIKELAFASKGNAEVKEESAHRINDNLSKSIRNDKEAKLFYSELKSAINLAKD